MKYLYWSRYFLIGDAYFNQAVATDWKEQGMTEAEEGRAY